MVVNFTDHDRPRSGGRVRLSEGHVAQRRQSPRPIGNPSPRLTDTRRAKMNVVYEGMDATLVIGGHQPNIIPPASTKRKPSSPGSWGVGLNCRSSNTTYDPAADSSPLGIRYFVRLSAESLRYHPPISIGVAVGLNNSMASRSIFGGSPLVRTSLITTPGGASRGMPGVPPTRVLPAHCEYFPSWSLGVACGSISSNDAPAPSARSGHGSESS